MKSLRGVICASPVQWMLARSQNSVSSQVTSNCEPLQDFRVALVEVLCFPVGSGVNLALSSASDSVVVRSAVGLPFFDKAFVNDRVEVGVETAVVDFFFVVVLDFVFDFEAVRFVHSGDNYQQIALKPC